VGPCDTFRGTISADTYKDFILTMLFLKYISDVWQDHYDEYKKQYGDATALRRCPTPVRGKASFAPWRFLNAR
jgi:type I restriction-modification system DNA methylase subunit